MNSGKNTHWTKCEEKLLAVHYLIPQRKVVAVELNDKNFFKTLNKRCQREKIIQMNKYINKQICEYINYKYIN